MTDQRAAAQRLPDARAADDVAPRSFDVIPAIDLRAGRVVRLAEGDFAREAAYGDDPAVFARAWAGLRPAWLHVVDLDGARAGAPRQLEPVARIVEAAAALGVPCEVAGGLRQPAAVATALAAGAGRVVLGTSLLGGGSVARSLVARFGPARICAAIDVRGGRAVGDAWSEDARGPEALHLIADLRAAGIDTFVVTAIARDGLLSGPDLGLLRDAVASAGDGHVIASGGVGALDDLRAARDAGCSGAIVGRALYEGRLSLADVLAAFPPSGARPAASS